MAKIAQNNGHEELSDKERQEMFAKINSEFEQDSDAYYAEVSVEQKLGVMQTLVHAEHKDAKHRQILLTAAFKDESQAMAAADAITERLRYGVTIQPVLDRIVAQCGIRGQRVTELLGGLNKFNQIAPPERRYGFGHQSGETARDHPIT